MSEALCNVLRIDRLKFGLRILDSQYGHIQRILTAVTWVYNVLFKVIRRLTLIILNTLLFTARSILCLFSTTLLVKLGFLHLQIHCFPKCVPPIPREPRPVPKGIYGYISVMATLKFTDFELKR
jgi:hypothetical protein